jgi:ribosomal-protein-alanine N-acetyltransferase
MTPPLDDVDRLMAVMTSAFDPAYGEAWTRRQVESTLLIGNCHYHLIDAAGNEPQEGAPAAGFFLSRTGFEEEELLLFAVDPAWRRRGLGHALLCRLVEAARIRGARRLLLEMRSSNPAESLYRAFGFYPIGQRPNYYRTRDGKTIDAITFAYDIRQV